MTDTVNHPPHYNSHPSGVECITVTEHMNFNLGNAVKYIWRAGLKSEAAVVDLEKARWYVEREIALENLPETACEEKDGGLEDSLYHALRALPKNNRQAVELLKLQGMDLESASKAIGISKVALKVRAHRGYVLLRKILLERN